MFKKAVILIFTIVIIALLGGCDSTKLKEVDGVIVDSVYARITNVSQNGIEMLIDCFVNTTDDLEFLEVKENINYVVMEILKNENINLA